MPFDSYNCANCGFMNRWTDDHGSSNCRSCGYRHPLHHSRLHAPLHFELQRYPSNDRIFPADTMEQTDDVEAWEDCILSWSNPLTRLDYAVNSFEGTAGLIESTRNLLANADGEQRMMVRKQIGRILGILRTDRETVLEFERKEKVNQSWAKGISIVFMIGILATLFIPIFTNGMLAFLFVTMLFFAYMTYSSNHANLAMAQKRRFSRLSSRKLLQYIAQIEELLQQE